MNARNLVALLILLAAGALLLTLGGRFSLLTPEAIIDDIPVSQADLSLEDLHYTQTEDGDRRWTLDARKAAYRKESGLVDLQDVTLVFFQVGPFAQVELTARAGTFDQNSLTVDARGDVTIVADGETRFFTERLRFNQKTGLVSTDQKVRMESPQIRMSGERFELDVNAGRFVVEDNVRASIRDVDNRENRQ